MEKHGTASSVLLEGIENGRGKLSAFGRLKYTLGLVASRAVMVLLRDCVCPGCLEFLVAHITSLCWTRNFGSILRIKEFRLDLALDLVVLAFYI